MKKGENILYTNVFLIRYLWKIHIHIFFSNLGISFSFFSRSNRDINKNISIHFVCFTQAYSTFSIKTTIFTQIVISRGWQKKFSRHHHQNLRVGGGTFWKKKFFCQKKNFFWYEKYWEFGIKNIETEVETSIVYFYFYYHVSLIDKMRKIYYLLFFLRKSRRWAFSFKQNASGFGSTNLWRVLRFNFSYETDLRSRFCC